MLIGMFALSLLGAKAMTNTQPDKNEDEEADDLSSGVEHQTWQTLDWTEPW